MEGGDTGWHDVGKGWVRLGSQKGTLKIKISTDVEVNTYREGHLGEQNADEWQDQNFRVEPMIPWLVQKSIQFDR